MVSHGTGHIWLDDVSCTGTETSIFHCHKRPWGTSNCQHNKDVGVDCQPGEYQYCDQCSLYEWTCGIINGQHIKMFVWTVN